MKRRSIPGPFPTKLTAALSVACTLVGVPLAGPPPAAAAGSGGPPYPVTTGGPAVTPGVVVGPVVGTVAAQPPTNAFCLSNLGIACYQPSDIQNEYDFGPLYAKGDTGAGQTIVIFDSFGSPTIASDLAAFDSAFGLPAPPSFQIYEPEGQVNYNYTNLPNPVLLNNKNVQTELGWAGETTLDVEWAHALAPGASIALVVVPRAQAQGVPGLQNMQNAQEWALDNHIGAIWSNSWVSTEQSFGHAASIDELDHLYAEAAASGITAFFASGDTGVANVDKQGQFFSYPTVNYPASSPNVVSVGGTEIVPPPESITSYSPEQVYNENLPLFSVNNAGGGGYSTAFAEPPYQAAAAIPDPSGMRAVPDLSMNAALTSGVLIWESFNPFYGPIWNVGNGTSEATPMWAATDAVMNQADGPLGFLAPRLYQIYEHSALYAEAFHDITVGNNSFAGITGYNARTGWDPASGLGSPDAAGLAAALTKTSP